MNIPYANYYSSSDLGLAAALVASGFSLDHLDKSNPARVEFVFQRQESLDEAIQSYWTGELSVSALQYSSSLKVLKNRIYSE